MSRSITPGSEPAASDFPLWTICNVDSALDQPGFAFPTRNDERIKTLSKHLSKANVKSIMYVAIESATMCPARLRFRRQSSQAWSEPTSPRESRC
jgi:hypothetical protein